MRRLILFLVRKKLRLKKFEAFRFTNQASDAVYYFSRFYVVKCWPGKHKPQFKPSGVSLNWLLDDECKIMKIQGHLDWLDNYVDPVA